MTKEEIYQRVEELILEEKEEGFVVRPDLSLTEHLAVDSVEVMELVLNLEDEFQVNIPDAAIETFENLSDIVDFIAERK